MRPIQFFLILGLLASLGLYWLRLRSAIGNRLLSLAFLLTALTAILFPQYTQVFAEYMGVGRGTDLVMYLFFVAAVFFGVLFYAKLARVERRQTEIVRAMAIASARPAEPGPRARKRRAGRAAGADPDDRRPAEDPTAIASAPAASRWRPPGPGRIGG